MTTQITTALTAILMEEGQVCLPGIGTLRRASQGALVSPIEGRALPPSDRVSFNANLVLDDGRLLRYLVAEEGMEREAAVAEIDRFGTAAREALDSGRSVVLEGIGRLFKHHDGRISFSGSGENFSKPNFGLPSVDIKPIVRSEKRKIDVLSDPMLPGTAGSAPAVDPVIGKVPRKKGAGLLYNDQLREYLWYAAGIIGIFVAIFGIYQIGQLIGGTVSGREAATAPRREVPRDRLNVPPPPPRADAPAVDAATVQPEPAPRLNEAPTTTTPTTVPSPDATVTQGEALIAIGLFGKSTYVEKNSRRLEDAGYEAYTRPEGPLTRLAARVRFNSPAELNGILRALQDRFTPDAYVMVLNGEEQEQ